MENMIDAGDGWMEPLLEFRDLLKATQDPEKKPTFREIKGRRFGRVKEKNNGGTGIIPRAYKFEFRKDLLRKLLETERKVNERRDEDQEYLELIREEELKEIRRIWRQEEADWEDSVPRIYNEVMKRDFKWTQDDLGAFTAEEAEVLERVCQRYAVPPKLVKRLLNLEREHHGMKRRAAIYNKIDSVFREEWRSVEDVIQEDEIEDEDPSHWEYDSEIETLLK